VTLPLAARLTLIPASVEPVRDQHAQHGIAAGAGVFDDLPRDEHSLLRSELLVQQSQLFLQPRLATARLLAFRHFHPHVRQSLFAPTPGYAPARAYGRPRLFPPDHPHAHLPRFFLSIAPARAR